MPNADRGGATKGKKGKLSKANMASKAAVVEEDVAVRQLKDLVEVLHVSERGPKVSVPTRFFHTV
jgi:ribosomal protein L24